MPHPSHLLLLPHCMPHPSHLPLLPQSMPHTGHFPAGPAPGSHPSCPSPLAWAPPGAFTHSAHNLHASAAPLAPSSAIPTPLWLMSPRLEAPLQTSAAAPPPPPAEAMLPLPAWAMAPDNTEAAILQRRLGALVSGAQRAQREAHAIRVGQRVEAGAARGGCSAGSASCTPAGCCSMGGGAGRGGAGVLGGPSGQGAGKGVRVVLQRDMLAQVRSTGLAGCSVLGCFSPVLGSLLTQAQGWLAALCWCSSPVLG